MNTRGRIRIGLIVGAGAALVMIAGTFAGVHYTSQSSFCASCHEMQSLHRDWTKGSHAKAECYDCHVDHTLSGQVMAKVNGLRQVYTHFTSKVDMEKVTAPVPNHRCARCHDMADRAKLGERITFAHQKHLEKKLECTVCHLTTGHKRELFVGFGHASCKECHSPERNADTPSHLRKVPCMRE